MEEIAILGDRHPLRAAADRVPEGFDLVLAPRLPAERMPRPARFVVRVHVRPPIELEISTRSAPVWSMARGLWLGDRDLVTATRWAHRVMFPRRRWPVDPEWRERARADMRELFSLLRSLAVHAADACDQAARRVALRFPLHLRFALYRRLVADGSGRLAQLAASCPGAVIFAFGLLEQSPRTRSAGERLLGDVIAGRRLDQALDEAIAVWRWDAGMKAHGRAPEILDPEARRVWRGLARRSRIDPRRPLRAQRLLIRRAGPRVPTTLLFLPPPVAFAPEDIPRAVRANAAWYRCMKSHPAILGAPGLTTLDDAGVAALSSFLSKHAAEVGASPHGPRRCPVAWLIDWMQATRRTPARASNPRNVLEECRRWHERLAVARELDEVRELLAGGAPGHPGRVDGRDLHAPFPEPPFPAFDDDTLAVRPIRTATELVEEGRRMHHCVAGLLLEAIAGRAFFYAAEVGGDRLTVHIAPAAGGYRIAQAKGVANREPTPRERAALASWIRAAGSAPGKSAGGRAVDAAGAARGAACEAGDVVLQAVDLDHRHASRCLRAAPVSDPCRRIGP